jgi:hypothetical protein
MDRIPIPGEVLRTPVLLGLTFMELATLLSIPIVVTLPAILIEQIPTVWTAGFTLLGFVGIVALIIRAPEGQQPLAWGAAFVSRKLNPETYYRKPKHDRRDRPVHRSAVLTAKHLVLESSPDHEASPEDIQPEDHSLVKHSERAALPDSEAGGVELASGEDDQTQPAFPARSPPTDGQADADTPASQSASSTDSRPTPE